MTTPAHTPKTNLRPEVQALMHQQDIGAAVCITPDPKDKSVKLGAVSRLAKPTKYYGFRLYTRTMPLERQKMLEDAEARESYELLMEVMDLGLSQVKTTIVKHERQHALGTSGLHACSFELPAFLSDLQRRMMAYYLPWKKLIQNDLDLMGRCFESVMGLSVRVEEGNARKILETGIVVDDWITNVHDQIGGTRLSENDCLAIVVGPVPHKSLPAFIPGTEHRRFWDDVLFPTFMPAHTDFELKVLVQEQAKFFSPHDNAVALTGINSYIQ